MIWKPTPSKEDINPHFTNRKSRTESIFYKQEQPLSPLQKRQSMYSTCRRNTEACSRNQLSRGNGVSIILSESASVALDIQHEKGMLVTIVSSGILRRFDW